ncbi:nucleotide sugar dehydrogenase [Myroides odoratus]|uniref:Nucleotide sugar dehydrogenase n=1 Tax=Myroides odoratus TaxID=256 RepID=A0A9Q6ZEL1_MYROD|nr:nucleotide sugar dehydrogenase [Myroides odoratus]EHQ43981.1 nucleotide sugar dehydrogenase [Myroides odoratus DSM 2801]EKB05122.1 nucleotide sugar dehydrogenase [Myroides odoratus CIP 103059]QQU01281.1 nucleotide sugar dehydrogenase [Myroides odoratus]WQD56461.1 nucleotide sugar dehydrogenase [Myroides odoratus]STZ31259.1 UDP-glucose 6-dehydrogenase tuaD [Myroides odoratus]
MEKEYKIAVVGQGYVGLPLALAFAKHYPVVGFDINAQRIESLQKAQDETKEADQDQLRVSLIAYQTSGGIKGYLPSFERKDLAGANVFIITVPTPINQFNAPDLSPLKSASRLVGEVLKEGDIVIYESTVYPGCTEEECIPVLEATSKLQFNRDFYVGYSPERINPGDKINTLETIVKVTSGSTPAIAEEIDQLYQQIIQAGTHKASSIKVAEAAKVIENAQRDVNISFVNELALIFDRIGIDTQEVLEAAGTKFNFLKFQPGLVGGHCISVDPYYLAHKSIQLGYYPDVILSGRRVNDEIPVFIASKVVKLMVQKNINVSQSKVLLLGFAFKENCPDTRNTKVAMIYDELVSYGLTVEVYDPWVNPEEVKTEYGITLVNSLDIVKQQYDAVVLTTAHRDFNKFNVRELVQSSGVVFDTKSVLKPNEVDSRL